MITAGTMPYRAKDEIEMIVNYGVPNNKRHSVGALPPNRPTAEELQLKKERVRQKYAHRNHERKIEMYFKALEIVRRKEENQTKIVTFKVNYATQFGQELLLCGNAQELGGWDLSKAVKMTWSEGNHWTCKVEMRANVNTILYKYILTTGQRCTPIWEWGHNHQLTIPVNKSTHAVVDVWGCGDAYL